MANNTTTAVSTLVAVIDEVIRASDFVPLPDNRLELDTPGLGLSYFLIAFNVISSVGGTLGNILTLLIVIISKKLHTVPNLFVAHLAAVDALICGVLLPLSIKNVQSGHDSSGSSSTCQVLGPLVVITMILSLLSMANIAANRYVLVCKDPNVYQKLYTKKTNVILIFVFSYIYAIVLILPPFAGLGVWTYNIKYKMCFFSAYDLYSYIYLSIFLNGAAFTPPASICIFSYYYIIKKFRESRTKFTKVSPVSDTGESSTSENSNGEGTKKLMKKDQEKNEKQAAADAKMFRTILGMLLVFIVFLVCWTPLVLTAQADFWATWPSDVYVAGLAFAYLNSCLNTFLYAWLNTNFREGCKLLLTCKWRKLRDGI